MAASNTALGYRHLFQNTQDRLRSRGITASLKVGPSVSIADFEPLEAVAKLPIPSSLRQFYLEVGNGLTFHWAVDLDRPSQKFCRLNVPTLDQLLLGFSYLRMLNECLASHDFREAQDVEYARRQFHRQLTYFPFLTANADLLCIEPTSDREAVVFCDHEWSDYPTGNSGVVLAESLHEFWRGWSQVGFVEPIEFWWPKAIRDRQAIWSEENFGFRLEPA